MKQMLFMLVIWLNLKTHKGASTLIAIITNGRKYLASLDVWKRKGTHMLIKMLRVPTIQNSQSRMIKKLILVFHLHWGCYTIRSNFCSTHGHNFQTNTDTLNPGSWHKLRHGLNKIYWSNIKVKYNLVIFCVLSKCFVCHVLNPRLPHYRSNNWTNSTLYATLFNLVGG